MPLLHVRSAQKSRAHTAVHQRQQPSGATADKRPTSKTSNGVKVEKKPAENSLQKHSGQQLGRHITACYHMRPPYRPGWLTAELGVGCSQWRITAFIELNSSTVFNFTVG